VTDRERLLKAILDNPEEDTPRLMFADEVEADQPHRAEFIRVGCELARTPETVEVVEDWPVEVVDGDTVRVSGGGFGAGFGADAAVTYALRGDTLTTTRRAVNPEYKRLCDRKNELLARHAYDWLPEIAGLDKFAIGRRGGAGSYFVGYLRKVMAPRGVLLPAPPPRLTTEFRRGFVERVTCSGDDWARHGDDILAAHPVRRVTFTDQGPSMVGVSFRPGPQFGTTVFRFAGRDVTVTASSPAHVLVNPSQFFTARWPIPPEGWAFAAGSRPPPF